jgi:flagellar hook assembly protein FlgD
MIRATGGDEFRSAFAVATMPAAELALHQNHPNPFNPQTTIRYDLPGGAGPARVRLLIVDTTGRRVRTLVDEMQSGGTRSVTWNGRDDAGQTASSGVYFYVLDVGKDRLTRKLVLLK